MIQRLCRVLPFLVTREVQVSIFVRVTLTLPEYRKLVKPVNCQPNKCATSCEVKQTNINPSSIPVFLPKRVLTYCLTPHRNSPRYRINRAMGSFRAGVGSLKKRVDPCLCQESNSYTPVVQPVAVTIPTELSVVAFVSSSYSTLFGPAFCIWYRHHLMDTQRLCLVIAVGACVTNCGPNGVSWRGSRPVHQTFIFSHIFILPSHSVIPPTVLEVYGNGIINSSRIIGVKGLPT
jgi:hypothetical protein